jgi:transcriptional regulator with XRE-family HTH domain
MFRMSTFALRVAPERRMLMGTSLGRLIRQRRIELGLTQEELAERVGDGVRQAEISRLERDRVTLPRRGRLEQIAQALDVPMGELLARSGWVGAQEQEAFAPDAVEPPAESPVPAASGGVDTEMHEFRQASRREEMPQLADAIARARALTQRTEDVIRGAQQAYTHARRSSTTRRRGAGPPPDNSQA